MPGAGQLKSSGERLSDRVAVGVLTQAFPAELVDEVLAQTNRIQQRNRLLPARLVVYFVPAMCLFPGQSYEEVARLLTAGLQSARRWRGSWPVPSTAAIWKARARLGVAPLQQLFTRVCRPVAVLGTQGAFYRRWRPAAIDGTTFDLPDTKANVEASGRPPRSGRGEQNVGCPQTRMAGLVECGTHAVFATAIGPLRTGERALAQPVLASLRPGMLLLADRGFHSVDAWCKAAATGADLPWRVRKDLVLPVTGQLPDGSYLTEIFGPDDIHHTRRGVPARAVEYAVAGHEGVYRLLTTILDPDQAPAAELAALYAQRWEFESALDEIKTHPGGSRLVLRSQHPDGAEQELYSFLLVHHAIRHLMHQAAQQADHDPDRISFTRSLRVVRRQVTGQTAFPPGRLTRAVKATHTELPEHLLPPRQRRTSPRVIKRKAANWPHKRAAHHGAEHPPTPAITIVNATKPKRAKRIKTS